MDIIAGGIDDLLVDKECKKQVYNAVRTFSNTLIKNQKDDYLYNINKIKDIITNLVSFVYD